MRNLCNPLYLYIKKYKSINNIKGDSFINAKKNTGIVITKEVLARFFRIYKVPAYRANEIVWKAGYKYRAAHRCISQLDNQISLGIGIVKVDEYGNCYSLKAPYARKFAALKMKKFKEKNLENKDLFNLTYELEGVKKYEIRIR